MSGLMRWSFVALMLALTAVFGVLGSWQVQRLGENAFEVVLAVTLTCQAGERTAYVAEVKQAGVFGLVGLIDHLLAVFKKGLTF